VNADVEARVNVEAGDAVSTAIRCLSQYRPDGQAE
jgi:hypothetical protein